MIIKYVQISLFRSLPRTAIAFTQGQHFVKSQSRYQDSIFVEGAERFFNVFDEISPLYHFHEMSKFRNCFDHCWGDYDSYLSCSLVSHLLIMIFIFDYKILIIYID